MHTPRLVIFDLDGTLAESKQPISKEMGTLLAELLVHVPVAVMSGAGFPQFEIQFLPSLPVDAQLENLYIFADNAAQCFVFEQDAWHARYDHAFTAEERTHILQALDLALTETGLHDAPVRVWGERVEDRGAEVTFSGLGQHAPLLEKEKWDPTHEKRIALERALAKRLPEFSEAIGGMTSVDITRKGITKAYGVLQLAALSTIPISDMLYVGDALFPGGNDAIVIPTGIETVGVEGPDDTEKMIEALLTSYSA